MPAADAIWRLDYLRWRRREGPITGVLLTPHPVNADYRYRAIEDIARQEQLVTIAQRDLEEAKAEVKHARERYDEELKQMSERECQGSQNARSGPRCTNEHVVAAC